MQDVAVPGDDDRLPATIVVRWSLSKRLGATGFIPALALAFVVGTFATVRQATAQQRAGAIVVIAAALAVAVAQVVRPRLTLSASEGVSATGLLAAQALPWGGVVAVEIRWWSDRTGSGYHQQWKLRGGTRLEGVLNRVLISEEDARTVRRWLARYRPEIAVDPVLPWRDRFGAWHTEADGYDPRETIRSVRRAHVGPWEIRVRSCEGGFRVLQRSVRDGEVVAEGTVLPTLEEAIADGVRFVERALVAADSAT